MTRGKACVLALLLVGLVGCLSGQRLSPLATSEPRFVPGTPEKVGEATLDVLNRLSIEYQAERNADGMLVRAATQNGGTFQVLLTRQAGQPRGQELTRMEIDWEKGPRDRIEPMLFATLDALSPRGPAQEQAPQ